MKVAVPVLTFCVAALLALGMVMLYSSSMTQVGAQYLIRQLVWCAMGLVSCVAAASLDYRLLQKIAWPLFGLAIFLLILVLIPHIGKADIGHSAKGARRWFSFHQIPTDFDPVPSIARVLSRMMWKFGSATSPGNEVIGTDGVIGVSLR